MKKVFLIAIGLILMIATFTPAFGAVGTVSAGQGDGFVPVDLCHATPTGAGGSGPANKYEFITVDNQGALNGHEQHPNDIIPAPEEGCPVIEDPEVCEDPDANNEGQPLPCTYDPEQVCEDPDANNEGQPLPCTYDPEQVCTDLNANNPGGSLPCEYGGGLEVPTCEEMSKMTLPDNYNDWRWGSRWERLGCSNQGYQTGSGFNLAFYAFWAGVVLVVGSGLSALAENRKKNAAQ